MNAVSRLSARLTAVVVVGACAPATPPSPSTPEPQPVASSAAVSEPAASSGPEVASPVPVASASAAPPPPDPRVATGPDGSVSWRAGLVDAAGKRKRRECPGNTISSVTCHVPETTADRIARADLPIEACPATGMVFAIPCAGCGDAHMPGGGGDRTDETTRAARHRAPSACCYAGCVERPPKPPPNAGRPLTVEGASRSASLVIGAASWG